MVFGFRFYFRLRFLFLLKGYWRVGVCRLCLFKKTKKTKKKTEGSFVSCLTEGRGSSVCATPKGGVLWSFFCGSYVYGQGETAPSCSHPQWPSFFGTTDCAIRSAAIMMVRVLHSHTPQSAMPMRGILIHEGSGTRRVQEEASATDRPFISATLTSVCRY